MFVLVEAFHDGMPVEGLGRVKLFTLSRVKFPDEFGESDKQEALRLVCEAFVPFGKRFVGVDEVRIDGLQTAWGVKSHGA